MDIKSVTLGFKDDEAYYAVNASGNRIEIDMLSTEKQAMSPMELLLSAIISCAAVDIVSMIKKRRKELKDIKGKVTGIRRDEQPRKYTSIEIVYDIYSSDLTHQEAERIVGLAVEKYCSVAASLDKDIQLSHSFNIISSNH